MWYLRIKGDFTCLYAVHFLWLFYGNMCNTFEFSIYIQSCKHLVNVCSLKIMVYFILFYFDKHTCSYFCINVCMKIISALKNIHGILISIRCNCFYGRQTFAQPFSVRLVWYGLIWVHVHLSPTSFGSHF